MRTLEQTIPTSRAIVAPLPIATGPILIAIDTTTESDAALRVGRALASFQGADAVSLSVVEPIDVPMYGVDGMVFNPGWSAESESEREARASEQMQRALPDAQQVPLMVCTGVPAQEIARTARELGARLVVVGRGHHSGIDRVLRGDPVVKLLQLGDVPVLVAHADVRAPHQRAVIATDFSPFSLYAAQVAMSQIAADGECLLVHVAPEYDGTVPYLREAAEAYEAQTTRSFEEFREALHHGSRHVTEARLTGAVAESIMDFARQCRADLIVTATHGRGFLRRMVLGSVAATLVHRASCSVLAVPASARAIAMSPRTRTGTSAHSSEQLERVGFDSALAAFTKRNRKRPCSVEIDSMELGAQVLGHGLPLTGASYDPHSGEVAVMFGTSRLEGVHITHTVTGVIGIDLLHHADGGDAVLRISHAEGQTLVILG
ncbi:MAG TPA: universal stress protein [Gemmatimonadaceae bacterium]|nr:universal stress protein [Gemmatimonadaceae bacterium]